MPRPKIINRVRKGDVLTVERWNDLVDGVNRNTINLGQGCGLEMTQSTMGGTALRITNGSTGFLAIANGNISKRSGSTAGSGNVYQVYVSGTTLSTGSTSIPVVNPSSNAMTSGNGIDSGQYCWVQPNVDGALIVTPLECS